MPPACQDNDKLCKNGRPEAYPTARVVTPAYISYFAAISRKNCTCGVPPAPVSHSFT
jgi:hypothetical protein